MTTKFVTSHDGTRIAYETHGTGPPLILVDGAFCYRGFGPAPKFAPLLSKRFTFVTYDRRGRGESADTKPWAIEREIEDLRALVDAVGGSASLLGLSSGAVLAMRAVASGVQVTKLAVYEPPLVVKEAPGPLPPERADEIRAHVAAGRRNDAVKVFMRMVGVPAIVIPLMRIMPGVWPKLAAVAHTLPNDLAMLGDTGASRSMPKELSQVMASIRVPTLAMVGGKAPPYMQHAVRIVADTVPGAEHRVLPGQTHNVAAKALAPVIEAFVA